MRPRHREEFEIAIFCSLPCEAEAIEALLDEVYDRFGKIYDKEPEDRNVYINGRIGKHNVVLCQVPESGKCSSASVASSLTFSYTGIQLALVVGICSGVPSPSCSEREIFLGDIVIADSVIEFDVGEQCPWGFQRETSVEAAHERPVLERPKRAIRNLLNALSIHGNRALMEAESAGFLEKLQSRGGPKWQYPGASKDILFTSAYRHQHRRESVCIHDEYEDTLCKGALEEECYISACAEEQVRRRRSSDESVKPALHVGMIASGDTVMESAEHRDMIAETEGVIAFGTIGAGMWDTLPCVIINGVSDYADGRKNEGWQNYAAAVAASGAKAFLQYWAPCAKASIQVRGVDEDAGAQILLRCAGVEEPDSPAVETAKAISRKVGGVPLVLEQAGSFLRCGLYSLHEYNRRFQDQFAKSTFKTPLYNCIGAYEKGHALWTVFERLYDAAGQRSSESINLLHLAVFLGSGLLPFSLIMYPSGDRNKYSVLFNSLSALEPADTSWLKIINWLNSLRSRETDLAKALQTLEDSGLVNFRRKRSDSMIESFEIDDMVRAFIRLKLSCHDRWDNAAVAFLLTGQYYVRIDAQSQPGIPQEHLGRLCTILDDFMSLIPLEMIQPPDGKYSRLCGSVAPVYARVCRLKGDYETSKSLWVLALQFIILSQSAESSTIGAKLEEIDAAADTLLAVDEGSIEEAWKRACESIALSPAARARKRDFGSGALQHDLVAEPMPLPGLGQDTFEEFRAEIRDLGFG
ncbi:hypothetical protein KXV68_007516 [Aspergillus fumigatus]|nr:hypothetical protein CNMCM8714_005499 [Aspergillus fumigatus]KAH1342437.1 hypothetical protein KXX67_006528 [Aspergillus fumigatus]KAH1755747.1 hypothetical protein KXX56_007264 [Aspergillus fumigatus]KAH1917091.1 hypothetical protein KXW69_005245 [Aspergillus fumigatus]KAH1962455.1 hypothetical protein KXV90_004025 [Aspergillus fumigatus]